MTLLRDKGKWRRKRMFRIGQGIAAASDRMALRSIAHCRMLCAKQPLCPPEPTTEQLFGRVNRVASSIAATCEPQAIPPGSLALSRSSLGIR